VSQLGYCLSRRVPFDPAYTAQLGAAVYVFAYYDWAIIYLIQQYQPSFVSRYSRGRPMTSACVRKALKSILSDQRTSYAKVSRPELQACCEQFSTLVDLRNALTHAHPITKSDGSQALSYQARPDRPIPDMKWPSSEVESALSKFDAAECGANDLLHRHI